MSLHKSLKNKGQLVRMRNVLNRAERIEILMREGRWSEEEDSPYGLPKVRVLRIKKRTKDKKQADDGDAEAAAEGEAAAESTQGGES